MVAHRSGRPSGHRSGRSGHGGQHHTPPERGIGKWTDQQIVRAMTEGVSADGRRLLPPMPFANYAQMTPSDLADLVAYLRSLPAQP